MSPLPIDELLPRLSAVLATTSTAILQAPPGAGKTTRVPPALLHAPWLAGQGILMLEPRRLAAVNAARWMASALGERIGATVGYAIRFDRQVSAATRIEVVTEGILARRLQDDPLLTGIGVVIFDEFHERSIHADLALALCRDVQAGLREELRILVMSATLDGERLSRLLGNAPVLSSEGKSFPVDIRHLIREEAGDPAGLIARAVLRAIRETEGDILAFLPGSGEIRRCQKLLEDDAATSPVLVTSLYGDLSFADQERAILPADRRKVVLATNIAETSLTIEGVRVVVDSGLRRQLRFDPGSGMDRLVTTRISQASAAQRAGRSGRLGPGVCFRLWTEHQERTLLPFDPPEILTNDLAPLALSLATWGEREPSRLSWLDPPPPAALAEAHRLLALLGAIDCNGLITPHGRAMASLPVHPRLAHLLLLARERGMAGLACDVAALLEERDIFRPDREGGERLATACDLVPRLEALSSLREGARLPTAATSVLDRGACRAVERSVRQLHRLIGGKPAWKMEDAAAVGLLAAWAYPDRIAREREAGSGRYLLANGRGARLSRRSTVYREPLLVAVRVAGTGEGEDLIHLATPVTMELLMAEFADLIVRERRVEWDERQGRVVAAEEERLGALLLSTKPVVPAAAEVSSAILARLASDPHLSSLSWNDDTLAFLSRVRFLARTFPEEGWPDLSPARLASSLPEWLGASLSGVRSVSDLKRIDLFPLLRGKLTWEQQRRLDEGAPTHMTVPSGFRVRLEYPPDGPPILAVKLQELFGLGETPTVARGRVPVLLHLLSPARRPIQVTQDLRGFWNGGYQEVKKELKGRYPKHPWPDDPWNAVPTRHTKLR